MRGEVSQSAQSNRWKLRREAGAGEGAGLRSGTFASTPGMLPNARGVEEERENVNSFLLHGLELVGIEAESLDDSRRDLLI
jgi:hypothetical protein